MSRQVLPQDGSVSSYNGPVASANRPYLPWSDCRGWWLLVASPHPVEASPQLQERLVDTTCAINQVPSRQKRMETGAYSLASNGCYGLRRVGAALCSVSRLSKVVSATFLTRWP